MQHGGSGHTYNYRRCRCAECRAANAARGLRLRAARTPEMAKVHGTTSTYSNYRCRCEPCTEANRLTSKAHRTCVECGSRRVGHPDTHAFVPRPVGRPRRAVAS